MRKFNNLKSQEVAISIVRSVETALMESGANYSYQSKIQLAETITNIMAKMYAELLGNNEKRQDLMLISAELYVFFKEVKKHISLDETTHL
jgi:hypothetical protein